MAGTSTLKIKSDAGEAWEELNPVLAKDQIGFDTSANRIKIGDGISEWNDLEYVGPDIVNSLVKSGKTVALSAEQGKVLKNLLDKKANANAILELVDDLSNGGHDRALSAEQGKILHERLVQTENMLASMGRRVDGLQGALESKADRQDVEELKSTVASILEALKNKVNDAPFTGKHYVRRNNEWDPTEAITSVTTSGVSLLIPGVAAKTTVPNVTAAWSANTVPVGVSYVTGLALAGRSDTVFVAGGNVEKARVSGANSTMGDVLGSFTLTNWNRVTQTTNMLPSHVVNASDENHVARSLMLGSAPDAFGTNLYYYGYVNGENPVETNLSEVISALGYAPDNDMLCAVSLNEKHELVPFTATCSDCKTWVRGANITTTTGVYHGLRLCWNPVAKQFYLSVNTGSSCEIYKSSNGLVWERSTSVTENKSLYPHALAASDALPWVFAGGNGFAKYTKDGATWNYCPALNGRTITAACYAPALSLFCVSVRGVGIMFSSDFETWLMVSMPSGIEYFTDMEWSESRNAIVAVNENTKSVFVLPVEAK